MGWCRLQLQCHDTDVTLLGHVQRLVCVLCLGMSAVPNTHCLGTPGIEAKYTANLSNMYTYSIHTHRQMECVENGVFICVCVRDEQVEPNATIGEIKSMFHKSRE